MGSVLSAASDSVLAMFMNSTTGPEFVAFPKMARLFRPVVITEKIDGTNAAVGVSEEVPYGYGAGEVVGPGIVVNRKEEEDDWDPVYVYAQSRKRIISPPSDNFGFARWVREHADELARGLGPGLHFGEYYGCRIQRGYGLDHKRFALFNVVRWQDDHPECCDVVPILDHCVELDTGRIKALLDDLGKNGSRVAPGYMNPEGLVVWHIAANAGFKYTLPDDAHKESQHASIR